MQTAERDKLFLAVAFLFAEHSTCVRGHVGAVIAREGRIIATGYNGAPPGMPHCTEVGCSGYVGCTRAVHAEANAIAFAGRYGIPCDAATMYCTHSPCRTCAHLMGSSGIVRVVFAREYRITEPIELLRELGMEVVHG
jgi:dCMP deaminase